MKNPFDRKQYAQVARRAAAEGCVLLKNDRNTLPFSRGTHLAVFGRSQFHYYKSGTGSGGSVNTDYVTGIYEALRDSGFYTLDSNLRAAYEAWLEQHPFDPGNGWASEPWVQDEMPLDGELVKKVAAEAGAAVVVIGRTAGEDQDNRNEPGSFLLTETERDMLRQVSDAFPKTVVLLNTGNIIDMCWVAEIDPAAVLYVWQGGQEGGNGVLDVLSGTVSPSGCLTDTIAKTYACYPSSRNFGSHVENVQEEDLYVGYRYFETFARDEVLYPFGFGLSYTSFTRTLHRFEVRDETEIALEICVKNTGNCPGKNVVQVYGSAPQGKLGKPARVLLAFRKTEELVPGEEALISFSIPLNLFASYDDGGLTGNRSCFVLEEGVYRIFAGENVRMAEEVGSFTLKNPIVCARCTEAMAPVRAFERLRPIEEKGLLHPGRENVPLQTVSPQLKRMQALPDCLPYTGDCGYKLKDVATNAVPMEKFLAQLSDSDLCAIIRGEGMCSPKVTPGIAGAFGGVTESLRAFGIPVAGCSDGPSGIRMDCGTHAFSLPNGTCLASTFNEELNEKLFAWEGMELRRNRIDALLGPGMNIHRNPLNGRNFEYFSEDPLLTGKIACAQLRGLQRFGVTGVIKHFTANTQETQRHFVNAVISERALREVYLRGFEIAIKEGGARAAMSTYGPVNGLWTSSSYDLLTDILRREWKFEGIVMTDWWAKANDNPGEEGSYQKVSAQVRAQNDLNMVNADAASNSNGDDLEQALAEGRLTRGELVRSAANICRFLLQSPVWLRSLGIETELDQALREGLSQEDAAMFDAITLTLKGEETEIEEKAISRMRGDTTVFSVTIPKRGRYQLEMEIRAAAISPMAQISCSIFKDRELIRIFSITGSDTEWRTVSMEMEELFNYTFSLKFYFAESGMEIRGVKLKLLEDCEESIRLARAARRGMVVPE